MFSSFIFRIFCAAFALVTIGCTSNQIEELPVQQAPCGDDIIQDVALFNATSLVSVNIQQTTLSAHCFTVLYTASGCDGNSWIPRLVSDGAVDYTSTPATRKVKFVLENDELCLAVFLKEKSFDLQSMQLSGHNSVQIRLTNNNQNFVYQY